MFSQTVEYGLRAVVWLAAHPDEAIKTEAISAKTQIPQSYLSKVLQVLVRGGIIESQPGPKGGYTISADPEELTLIEVINLFEPIRRIESCPLKLKAHRGRLCPLHARMDAVRADVLKTFRNCTFSDLLHEDPSTVPLCVEVKE